MGNCTLKTKFGLSFASFLQARENDERKGHKSWNNPSPVPKSLSQVSQSNRVSSPHVSPQNVQKTGLYNLGSSNMKRKFSL